MLKTISHQKVLYGMTDRMGVMYYGHYPLLYELGRTDWIRQFGIPYKTMEDDWNIALPVLELNVRYLRPATYDELIQVTTDLKELPSKIIIFEHELFNENQEVINRAIVKLGFFDMKNKKLVFCPDYLMNKIQDNFESDQ